MASVTLITGGARSGKSSLALSYAMQVAGKRIFVATAEACDDEMRLRIDRHRAERGSSFETIEEPVYLATRLKNLPADTAIAVIDCLTVWLGNVYYKLGTDRTTVKSAMDELVATLESVQCNCILVTNEVGWGIVPDNAMARDFRDDAGYLNRRVAAIATQVYLSVCGIVQKIKGEKNA